MKRMVNPFIFPSELTFYFLLMVIQSSFPLLWFTIYIANSTRLWKPPYLLHLLLFTALFFLTWLLYKRNEKVKISRYKANRVEDRYPELSSLIFNLCSRFNVRKPIILYFEGEPLDTFVVGYGRKPYLLVSTGLCEMYSSFPDMVETILLHELSHIKNRDLFQHEVAESLWKSFIIIAGISILLSFIESFRNSTSSLYSTFSMYILPSVVLFYLNSAIKKWREIYADVRTAFFQKTCRNLLTLFRLLSSHGKISLRSRILSPFVLTINERIKLLQEGFFKNIGGRISLCVAVTTTSIVLNVINLYDLNYPWFPLEPLFFIWIITHLTSTSIMALPHLTYFISEARNKRQLFSSILLKPLKLLPSIGLPFLILISISTLPLILISPRLLDYRIIQYFIVGFVLGGYAFLFLQELLLLFILGVVKIRISPKIKVVFSEIPILLTSSLIVFHLLGMETFPIIILTIVMLVPLMAFLSWKYIKCPYCGGKIEPYNVFQCPHCLNALNEEFLVSLQE